MNAKTRGNVGRVKPSHPARKERNLRGATRPLPQWMEPRRATPETLDPARLPATNRGEVAAIPAAPPPGWHRLEDRACLRALAGGGCATRAGVEPCACRAPFFRILDHVGLWCTPEGLAVVAQPYSFDVTSDEFVAFVGFCRDLGLSVHVEGGSWYSPGATVLIVVRRARQDTAESGLGEIEDL